MTFILLLSIQHTGTRFCIDLLRNHSDVDGFVEHAHLTETKMPKGNAMVHLHFGGHNKPVSKEEQHPIPTQYYGQWIQDYKAVIPVRDPLLSLITKYNRDTEKSKARHLYFNTVNGFVILAEWFNKFGKRIFVLPVDLAASWSIDDKFHIVNSLFEFVGLRTQPIDLVRNFVWAVNWPVINTTNPGNPLREAYNERNEEFIKRAIKEEYEYLQAKEDAIRPFLEKLGYSNLPWWS